MDGQRFDAISRTFAAGVTRRGVLRSLLGTALGGVAAVILADEAGARDCRKAGQKCLRRS
jgi:hypothetical protein